MLRFLTNDQPLKCLPQLSVSHLIVQCYRQVDPSRIYVTGLSLGASGTWHLALRYGVLAAWGRDICLQSKWCSDMQSHAITHFWKKRPMKNWKAVKWSNAHHQSLLEAHPCLTRRVFGWCGASFGCLSLATWCMAKDRWIMMNQLSEKPQRIAKSTDNSFAQERRPRSSATAETGEFACAGISDRCWSPLDWKTPHHVLIYFDLKRDHNHIIIFGYT